MTGEPLPYIMRNDWLVTTILFLCLLGVLFIFSKGRKFLLKQTNGILVNKERSNLFDEATSSDTQYAFFLVSHACIMLVFCLYSFFAKSSPVLFDRFSHFELLVFSAGCVVALFLLKWSAYSFVNWIFFEEARNRLWIQFYFNIFIWMGLLLLPIVLLVVYFAVPRFRAWTNKKCREIKSELKNVTWSPWRDVKRNTVLVILIVVAAAAAIGLLDFVFAKSISALSALF